MGLMGCKCNISSSDKSTEMKNDLKSANLIDNDKHINNDEIVKIEEEYMKKYAGYSKNIMDLINKIRKYPREYAEIIENSIKNIIIEDNNLEPNNPKIIYKQKIKVALHRGEPAFKEAAGLLRKMSPLSPLEFKEEICIPLPDNEKESKDSNYLRNKVKEMLSKKITINSFFKDLVKIPEISILLMIVDDNGKSAGKKRRAILNKDYKYIGINFRFFGENFISYFSFAK